MKPWGLLAEVKRADSELGVSVVVCAYTLDRWERTRAALSSVLGQRPEAEEVLLVVDHNADLAACARREFSGVRVLESDGPPGLSGARNTGLRAASQPITVFLDDDAEARAGLAGVARWPEPVLRRCRHRRQRLASVARASAIVVAA